MKQSALEFVDTHCHVQFSDYPLETGQVISQATEQGVNRLIVVGCGLGDSQAAVEMANQYKNVWASIGLHPHEASLYADDHKALQQFSRLTEGARVVAVGEAGLDFYYNNSPKADQIKLLSYQIELALSQNLPMIFHVRDAFKDFWQIFDSYSSQQQPIRGVIHSFSSNLQDLEPALERGLYIGLNGIMTFTKRPEQLEAAKKVPLESLVLETDAPFLTPVPFRGKIGEPKYVRTIAEFLASLRGEDLEDLAKITTSNAIKLFNL